MSGNMELAELALSLTKRHVFVWLHGRGEQNNRAIVARLSCIHQS